jgi:hypothetical protein
LRRAPILLNEVNAMAAKREHIPRLEFYWYEAKEGEEISDRCGQLTGSIHRLHRVTDELDSVVEENDIERGLTRLAYHVENYLNHVFELRDRALGFVSAITGQPKAVEQLKNPKRRAVAIKRLNGLNAAQSRAISRLFACLQADIELRNRNTHETYLALGLYTGDDVKDPHDVPLDVEGWRPVDRTRLESTLRREMERVVARYRGKIRTVVSLTMTLLQHTDPVKAS